MTDVRGTDLAVSTVPPTRLQKRVEEGEIFILRGMAEIRALLESIAGLACRYLDGATSKEIRAIIQGRELPDDRRIAAIARALRRERNEVASVKVV